MTYRTQYPILILLVLFPLFLGAADFYISPSGSDNSGDGTKAKPWKSLRYAANQMQANQGHTLILEEGTYVETGQVKLKPGVNIRGAGIDKTILTASSSFYEGTPFPYRLEKMLISSYNEYNMEDGNHSISGFTIDGKNKNIYGGILIHRRRNVKIFDVKVKETYFTGIWLFWGENIEVHDIIIRDCSWGNKDFSSGGMNIGGLTGADLYQLDIEEIEQRNGDKGGGYGVVAIGPWYETDLIDVKLHDSKIKVHHIGLWENGLAPNFCIEYHNVSSYNCEIYRNEVNNVMSLVDPTHADPKDLNRNHSVRVYDNFFNISDINGYPLEITNNRVEVFGNVVDGNASSLFIANWETAEKQLYDWHVHHNFFYDFAEGYPKAILMLRQGIRNLRFEHNTVEVADESMALFWFQGGKAEDIYVRNNLVYRINEEKSWGQPISDCLAELNIDYDWYTELSDIYVENNIFHNFEGEKVLKGGFSVGGGRASGYDPYAPKNFKRANNLEVSPQLVRTGNKPDPYFTLSETSPAIDAGFKIQGQSYEGNAPDIGALEFEGAAMPENTPPTFTISGDLEVAQDFTDTLAVQVTPDPVPVQEQDQTVTYTLSPASVDFANVFFNPNNGEVKVTAKGGGFGFQVFTLTADDGQPVNNTASREFRLTISQIEIKDTLETGSLPIRVNSGGDDFLTPDAKLFYEDQPKWVFGTSSNFENPREISGSSSDVLYHSERVGKDFSYKFPVPDGVYEVKLHFAEIYFFEAGQRVFDVDIEDGLAGLRNFDILAETSRDRAIVKTFSTLIVQDDTLSIDFKGVVDNAKISAIQVLLLSDEVPENTPPVFSLSEKEIEIENTNTQSRTVEVIPAPVPEVEKTQQVTYSLTPASVDFATVSIDPETGKISLTPKANRSGEQTFIITADDGQPANNLHVEKLIIRVIESTQQEPDPKVPIPFRMNAGGTSYVLPDESFYVEDQFFNEDTWTYGVNRSISDTDIEYIYQTERAGPEIKYEIPIENGTYKVVLRFAEIFFQEEGLRIMEAGVENEGLILENLDLYKMLGIDRAWYTVVRNISVTDEYLSVYLRGLQDNAQISGIEIYRNDDDSVFPELVSLPFRMNVGGVSANTYLGDFQADKYVQGNNQTYFINALVETELAPSLYQTYREGEEIIYRIPVGMGTYDLKLHWIEWDNSFPGERIFRVQVEEEATLPENMDVLAFVKKGQVYTQSLLAVENTDEWLDITLTGLRRGATLAAIEILPEGTLTAEEVAAPIFRLDRTRVSIPANSADVEEINAIPTSSLSVSYQLIPAVSQIANLQLDETTGKVAMLALGGQVGEEMFILEATHQDKRYRQAFSLQISAVAPPSPDDSLAYAIRINAGGKSYVDSRGHTFQEDTFFTGNSSVFINSAQIQGTQELPLYQTERIGEEMTYEIPLEKGEYDLYLHFVETFWDEVGRRILHAEIEGQVLFEYYDIFGEVGKNRVVVKAFKGIQVEDGIFNFRLYASSNVATLSALELVKVNGKGGIQLTDLQQSIRINTGAQEDKAFGGFIFLRDSFYGPSTSFLSSSQQDIQGTNFDELYKYGRQSAPGEPLDYDIPMVNGQYEVYLHFAEQASAITQSGQREMQLSLEGELIGAPIDIVKEKGIGHALIKHYTVSVADKELNIQLLPLQGRPTLAAIEVLSPQDQDQAIILQPSFTSLGSDFSAGRLTVFPNPTAGKVKVLLEGEWEGKVEIKLINSLGQEIERRKLTKENWILKEQLVFENAPSGLYWVQLTAKNGTQSKLIYKE
ncbi:MAG: malectin domain-containing carbohydrate-binding protein [Bacteroidota bacterium]